MVSLSGGVNGQKKSVTVLVAVKDKRNIVGECIQALLDQDYPYERIMVIDNGSTDSSLEILRGFNDRIELHQRGGGVPEIFNWALDRIDTEFVAFTDADCVPDKRWLSELMAGFEEEGGLVGVAGWVEIPKNVSLLRRLVSLYDGWRYKSAPRYVLRSSTMNMCLVTEIARRVRFNKRLKIAAFETDFCYRLIEHGRILFRPGARVLHYHRTNLMGYFRQQKNYARYALWVYCKHPAQLRGDHISTLDMIAQVPLLSAAIIAGILGFFFKPLLIISGALFLILLALYIMQAHRVAERPSDYLPLIAVFILRNVAWVVGSFQGIPIIFK